MGTFTITQLQESEDIYLIPNSNGCNIELTPVGEINNWECVDDPINNSNGDIDYVYNDIANLKYDLYELPNHTTEIGTINYVQIFTRAKSHQFPQSEIGIYKIILTDNNCTNIYKSEDIDLTTSYASYTKLWTINPRTAAPWIWADIDNLQSGLECNSPQTIGTSLTTTIRPNAPGSTTQLTPHPSPPNWNANYVYATHYTNSYEEDTYNLDAHGTAGTGTITRIVVYTAMYGGSAESPIATGKILIDSNGTKSYGTEESLEHTGPDPYQVTHSYEWTIDPNTSSAWTWTAINNLQAGIALNPHGMEWAYSYFIYVVVYYTDNVNPEIRTTQCYVKVNYVPPTTECTLNKPEEISVDHDRNIKMLNFWSGNREVYDLSRNSKSMILTGSEYQSDTCNKACPCEHITCIRNMGKTGLKITISGLRSLFNGNFKIRSFGWKHISKKPENYEWILELEYDD